MTGWTGWISHDQDGIGIAINMDIFYHEVMHGCFPLRPQALFTAAVKGDFVFLPGFGKTILYPAEIRPRPFIQVEIRGRYRLTVVSTEVKRYLHAKTTFVQNAIKAVAVYTRNTISVACVFITQRNKPKKLVNNGRAQFLI